jgi:hypothetical protein
MMPNIDFSKVRRGTEYTRGELSDLWGYAGYQAIARGVVTPAQDNKIVLFVTENKSSDRTQYQNRRRGSVLEWEGPTDHFAEDRMAGSPANGDQIHVFYRMHQKDRFEYLGQYRIRHYRPNAARPSHFQLELIERANC